ncbi:lysophospholipid acyltransferase family protein [Clostridium sp. D33t1_170424_F3]|uniref:lysophospholipid acyltransferase family protein n=1 Tax=Clostridium sp. D33t1_170424_F3 TaxID=2787099 RepID=UPI0018AAC46D|nr:lysophospholipid acyltransferase family protein [Clostridium sp. D33t1_170424_F3]
MKRTPLYAFAKAAAQWIVMPFVPYRVKNKERFPKEGKVIVCCNHLGISDPLRLGFTQHRQIFFMSKAELFDIKPLGWLLRALGAFPVHRGKGDVNAIDSASELLQEGCALGIFIEGTRSRDGEFGQPKAGAVMLAYNNHAPILPACITPVGSKKPRLFHKAVVSFGELIQPEELGIEHGAGLEFRNASRLVMGKIRELRERDLLELGQEESLPEHIA